MTGGIEAVGSVIEGGMLARVVEPKAGEGDGHTHEGACLNCGTALVGPHCHQCGQHAHVHKTLGAFFHDLLHGVLHFEGKIWRTLPQLVWRPGRLTREYIDGRRASYVSPIALFLFVVFLTFAGFHALGGGIDLGDKVDLNGQKVSVAEAQKKLDGQIAGLQAKRAAALKAGKPVTEIDEEIDGLRGALDTVKAVKADDVGAFTSRMAPAKADGSVSSLGAINSLWRKAKANPELLLYKLQSNAYKYSWLLIPISVPFVWLLFPFNRRFRLYDHTVFVTYSLSFMMMALLVASVGAKLEFAPLVIIPVLYAPFHIYRQIRETYGTTRLGAVVRAWFLHWFAAIALVIWAIALFGLLLGE